MYWSCKLGAALTNPVRIDSLHRLLAELGSTTKPRETEWNACYEVCINSIKFDSANLRMIEKTFAETTRLPAGQKRATTIVQAENLLDAIHAPNPPPAPTKQGPVAVVEEYDLQELRAHYLTLLREVAGVNVDC